MSHTKGPWRIGKNYGGIVADHPIEGGVMGTEDVEAYGGYLIAETVAPCNKPIIAAAPQLLEAVKSPSIEKVFQWLIDCPNDEADSEHVRMCREFRDFVWAARAAIAKAEAE